MTPTEVKKFIEEANKRAEESARKWHANKRLNQARRLVPSDEIESKQAKEATR